MMQFTHQLRSPCPECSSAYGRVETRNGQDCVYCECGRWQYNAPRRETGRSVRHISERDGLPPSKRSRILERDNYTCVMCGRRPPDIELHIGHLISHADGRAIGMAPFELDDDENLAAMCGECNLGQGSAPVSLRYCARLLKARMAHQRRAGESGNIA